MPISSLHFESQTKVLKKTLLGNKQRYHQMKTIRSNNHQLGSYELNKVSLSCFDDKRYIHKTVSTVMLTGIIVSLINQRQISVLEQRDIRLVYLV